MPVSKNPPISSQRGQRRYSATRPHNGAGNPPRLKAAITNPTQERLAARPPPPRRREDFQRARRREATASEPSRRLRPLVRRRGNTTAPPSVARGAGRVH